MGINLNTILGALAGGATAYGTASERALQRQRQAHLDAILEEDRKSQRERRDFENLHTISQLGDEGIVPATSVPPSDQTDYSNVVGAGVAAAGGMPVGLPAAKAPNAGYIYAGSAGGTDYFYNPQATREAKALQAKDQARAAEVARLMGMHKPDGTPLSKTEAEAIVDGNVHYGDFKEKNVDRLSPEGISSEKALIDYRTAAQRAAREASAKTGKTETREQREKYLNGLADQYIESAAARVGDKDKAKLMAEAVNQIVTRPDGKRAMSEGLTSAHVRAAVQRFRDRFTAKSKQDVAKPNLFDDLTGDTPAATPAAPPAAAEARVPAHAPAQVDLEAIKRKYQLEQ